MRSSWPWLVTFALVALTSTGCAKGVASMSVTQIAPAGLEPQDVVGVVVVNGTEAMEQKWAQRVSKCVDHLPLHRPERVYQRQGLFLHRSTLCDWMAAGAGLP